ncbi:hypothetical protein ARMGADRAFT_947116, partial [Armillaria gallica]
VDKILEVFRPNPVVLQCGADSLSGDKLGCFNLMMRGHVHCVQYLRKKNVLLTEAGTPSKTLRGHGRMKLPVCQA